MNIENPEKQNESHHLDFEDSIDVNKFKLESPGEYEQWLSRLIRKGLLVRREMVNPDGSLKEVSITAPFDILGPDNNVIFKKDAVIDYRNADELSMKKENRQNKLESSFKTDGEGVGSSPLPMEMLDPEELEYGREGAPSRPMPVEMADPRDLDPKAKGTRPPLEGTRIHGNPIWDKTKGKDA